MRFLIIAAVLITFVWVARDPRRRALALAGAHRTAREVRVFTGEYRLDDLVERLIGLALGSAVRGVTRTYLPVVLEFGIAKDDAEQWAGLLPLVTDELRQLLVHRAMAAGHTVRQQPTVSLVVSADARPGRPVLLRAALPKSSTNGEGRSEDATLVLAVSR